MKILKIKKIVEIIFIFTNLCGKALYLSNSKNQLRKKITEVSLSKRYTLVLIRLSHCRNWTSLIYKHET